MQPSLAMCGHAASGPENAEMERSIRAGQSLPHVPAVADVVVVFVVVVLVVVDNC